MRSLLRGAFSATQNEEHSTMQRASSHQASEVEQLLLTRVEAMPSPKCAWCKKAVVGPRLVIQNMWCCTTCAYYLDQGLTPPGQERE